MAKYKYNTRCKYCGCKINGGEICSGCRKKLPLIRQLLGTVKDAKRRVDIERRIKDDLKRVRDNG